MCHSSRKWTWYTCLTRKLKCLEHVVKNKKHKIKLTERFFQSIQTTFKNENYKWLSSTHRGANLLCKLKGMPTSVEPIKPWRSTNHIYNAHKQWFERSKIKIFWFFCIKEWYYTTQTMWIMWFGSYNSQHNAWSK